MKDQSKLATALYCAAPLRHEHLTMRLKNQLHEREETKDRGVPRSQLSKKRQRVKESRQMRIKKLRRRLKFWGAWISESGGAGL